LRVFVGGLKSRSLILPNSRELETTPGGTAFSFSKGWITRTNAIGLTASTGRYGGTYVHQDIAFEFGSRNVFSHFAN